jgi:hypothetical protein
MVDGANTAPDQEIQAASQYIQLLAENLGGKEQLFYEAVTHHCKDAMIS